MNIASADVVWGVKPCPICDGLGVFRNDRQAFVEASPRFTTWPNWRPSVKACEACGASGYVVEWPNEKARMSGAGG